MKIYSAFRSKYLELQYLLNDDDRMGMLIMPLGVEAPYTGKGYFDSLAHVCLAGDGMDSGFAAGCTMRNSDTAQALRFSDQRVEEKIGILRIITRLKGNNLEVIHTAELGKEARAVLVNTEVVNIGDAPADIMMLSTFSMGGLTPLAEGEANDRLKVHRITSTWSSEGRILTQTPVELNMEKSWSGHGYRTMRFGEKGSHPVKGFFPFLALEDTEESITWGALLCGASSWQMELTRRQTEFCISGGIADADFGCFTKHLEKGESILSPDAIISAAKGGCDALCRNICAWLNKALPPRSDLEADLPIIFNEFCTTWGNPNLDNIRAIVDRIAGHGMTYFVIDAGWYARPDGNWETDIGDWQVSDHMFPGGIRIATDYIRSKGMVPGLWFELENVGPTSKLADYAPWLLKRNGHIIRSGYRRMLDMENPDVIAYLDDAVLRVLKEGNFGYIKVDYNESMGIAVDGYESPGEGVRRKVLANQAYFRHLKEEIPDLVIESCASGGHRLVPSMMAISDMSSVSDAHECPEIPIVVANTARVVPARHNQIWAVMRAEDSDKRLKYSLSAAMLGRMCLSGDVHNLSEHQWAIIDEAIAFYGKIKGILAESDQFIVRRDVDAYRDLQGQQTVMRIHEDQMLVVAHNFSGGMPLQAKLPEVGSWQVAETFGIKDSDVSIENDAIQIALTEDFSGCAVLLRR